MYDLKQWRENKGVQEEYETFYRSSAGVCMRDTLINMMLSATPEISKEASILEAEAMRGVYQKGMLHMIRFMDFLRPERLHPSMSKQEDILVSPSGLPYTAQQKAEHDARYPKPPKEPAKAGEQL